MAREVSIFIVILAINFLVTLCYLIWKVFVQKDQNRRNVLIRSVIMLLCPIVGICFFGLAHIFFLSFFSEPVDLEDVVFSKERVKTFVRADEESERNLAPLEESISVTDKNELRKLMMNVVRGDIHKSLTAISLALNSEDSETAHYAATVLQDALNDFRTLVERKYEMVKSDDKNKFLWAGQLIDYMYPVLNQKVFTEMEQITYIRIMNEVCEILYNGELDRMTSGHMEQITLLLLSIKEYEEAEKWCRRATYVFPNTLATYTSQLKLYFNSGQKERFFEVIEELKKSAIVIDNETLELIRVFR